jgi:predicted transcriptional regulator
VKIYEELNMTTKKYESFCVTVNPEVKETIKRIADKNNMSISYVARLLLADSIKHINERNVLKMVV